MKQKFVLFILLLTLLGTNHASAHNFFVNITESMAHPPGSIVANIGWGHAMPMDDFLQGDTLDTYAIYDPGLKKMDFPFSPDTNKAAEGNEGKSAANFPGGKMLAGDAYARKVLFNENSPQGTYQIAASIKKTQFAVWTDQQGREKWGRKTLDQIKDAKEVKLCWRFQSFAKAFVPVGAWSEPKPVGHDLEMVPLTDLSKVRVGDEVEFKVLMLGQPLEADFSSGLPVLEAYGEQYGADGNYGLQGRISKGIAKIRVTAPGKWLATVRMRKPVSKEDGPAELVGKALEVGYNAAVTFFVRE